MVGHIQVLYESGELLEDFEKHHSFLILSVYYDVVDWQIP
jgi:hypothetical protein